MALETTLALAAKPLVTALVDKLVVPKLKQFSKWCKDNYNEFLIPTAEHFQEYLERSYTKYSIVNTLVFHNSLRFLKDIYVPQSLVKKHLYEDDKETTKIDKLPVSLIKKYKKILIIDTAGAGKSTILKYMFIDLIDNCFTDVGIPIYIELRKLNNEHTILNEIQEELSSLSKHFDNELLLKFIQTGGFIFFLDGFDEISLSDRSEVTNDIQMFISKTGTKNHFILTSRPENSLASFGDFYSFTIQPFAKEDSFELLKKYDISTLKKMSTNLVELLKSGLYDSLDEYLEKPLLVSLLFTAYDFNRSIPFEKHRFCEVVFEAFFEKHDNTKPMKTRDKLSGLNHDGFDRILRYIGYVSLVSIGVKFNEDTILNSIREAKEYCGILDFSESDFLKDLTSSVPLFCKDGTEYKWAHKSLMEYFAARFIYCDAKNNQDAILSAIYNSENINRYLSMMDLYGDMDYRGFEKNFTFPFCKEFLEFRDKNNIKSEIINQEIIEEIIGLTYAGIQGFIICRLDKNIASFSVQNTKIIHYGKVGKDGNYHIIIYGDANKFQLYQFMWNKQPQLFYQAKHENTILSNVESLFDIIKPNLFFHLDTSLGLNDQELYRVINLLIQPLSLYYIIDHKACVLEIDMVRKDKESKFDFFSI